MSDRTDWLLIPGAFLLLIVAVAIDGGFSGGWPAALFVLAAATLIGFLVWGRPE